MMPRRATWAAVALLALCFSAPAQTTIYSPRVMIGDRLVVPLRGVLETLGFEVGYEKTMDDAIIWITPTDAAPATDVQQVSLTVGDTYGTLIDQNGGHTLVMDVPPQIIGGKTYVPLRFVAETFGYEVDYQGAYVDFNWGGDTAARLMLTGGAPAPVATPRPEHAHLAAFTAWRKVSDDDLYGWTNWDLTLVRNEIYARHGRPFSNAHIRAYFMAQDWYRPDRSFRESRLSAVEKYNSDFIKRYQTRMFRTPATKP